MTTQGEALRFDWNILSGPDLATAKRYIPDLRAPDLVIDSDHSTPYLYRWFVVPRNEQANVYFHIQTADDPERPLHDHPWDNQSIILSGGYYETQAMPTGAEIRNKRIKGDAVHRLACHAHRLELLPGLKYTMTQFSTGPKLKKWGFYIEGEWVAYDECCTFVGNRTLFVYPERYKHLRAS